MGKKLDVALLILEWILGLVIVISGIGRVVRDLTGDRYIGGLFGTFLTVGVLILLIIFLIILFKMKNKEFYEKYKLPIRLFIWTVFLTLLFDVIFSPLLLIFEKTHYFLIINWVGICFAITSFIIFFILKKIDSSISFFKILSISILLLLFLTLLFWPKPCGTFSSAVRSTATKCNCMGITTRPGNDGRGIVYCSGICLKNSCKFVIK